LTSYPYATRAFRRRVRGPLALDADRRAVSRTAADRDPPTSILERQGSGGPSGLQIAAGLRDESDWHTAGNAPANRLSGFPFTSFAVNDISAEFERLRALGVRFTQEPVEMSPGDHGRVRRHMRQPHPDAQQA
jgi:hypothetical protein